MSRVDIGLSGGVDSAVAAHLLMAAGHDVRGVTMQLLHGGQESVREAREVAAHLGIEHRVIDLRDEFEHSVLGPFADEYAAGRTPNPCIACNETVKFGALLRDVLQAGADALATGHYARIVESSAGRRLGVARDANKDQTYFLYRLSGEVMDLVEFPLGEFTKDEVREYARAQGLPVHERPESQEACFAPDGDYLNLVADRRPDALTPGPTIDESGCVVGRHAGIATVTIGQRRGVGAATGGRRYVTSVDPGTHTVRVGERDALSRTRLHADAVVWHANEHAGSCEFKFRHGRSMHAGTYEVHGGRLMVTAEDPVWGVAPGQSLVCYKEEVVLGGGVLVDDPQGKQAT